MTKDELIALAGKADCTGDEQLWVPRYAGYLRSVTGWSMVECVLHANIAYEAWGDDPDCTPEEVASSDAAELREGGAHATTLGD